MATTTEILKAIKRKEARGQSIPDRFVRNLFAAELDVNKARALEGERLGLAKEQEERLSEGQKFSKNLTLSQLAEQEKARKQEGRASAISGVAQLGFLGATAKAGLDTAAAKKIAAETAAKGAFTPSTGTTGSGAFTPGTVAPTTAVEASTLPTGVSEAGASVAGSEAAGTTLTPAAAAPGLGTAVAGVTALKIGHDALVNQFDEGDQQAVSIVSNPIFAQFDAATEALGVKIICTELNRQGYMDDDIYALDSDFGRKQDTQVMSGYIKLATPIVGLMRRSWCFTQVVRVLATPWSLEMAHLMKPEKYKSNIIGKIIMKIGIPLCRLKGVLTEEVA